MPLKTRPIQAGHLYPVIIADIDDGIILPVSIESNNAGPKAVILVDPDDNSRQAEFDVKFSIPIVIDIAHHEIHEGDSFVYNEMISLDNGVTRDILMITPNTTEEVHILISVVSTLQSIIEFYEGTTTTDDGTVLTTFNRNRNSGKTANAVLYHTPTITLVGTMLIQEQLGSAGAGGSGKIGGDSLDRGEFLLKFNTRYLLRVTSGSNSNVNTIYMDWYEHIPE